MGGMSQKIDVPYPDQRRQYRQVAFQRRIAEMLIHLVGAGEEFLESLETDREGDRQANGRPQRVAPPHPIPESEHALGDDAKGGGGLEVSRNGGEMMLHEDFGGGGRG